MKPINDIAFCLNDLDRSGEIRGDKDKLFELFNSPLAKIILFKQIMPLMGIDGDKLIPIYFKASELPSFEKSLFLGIDGENAPYFIVQSMDENLEPPKNGEFLEIRQNMLKIDARDISILGTARSLLMWHEAHGFCPKCGHKSIILDAGWKRYCENCHTEHFPRIDPVAIMLVLYGDKCLLARSINFPEGLYSNLAGFIEPGETLEQGCAREVLEEVGIKVENIQIIGNQPWPNPSQLMIGMIAYAQSDKIEINPTEVLDAGWFTKEEVRALLSGGMEIKNNQCFGPRITAIAYHLLQYWLNE